MSYKLKVVIKLTGELVATFIIFAGLFLPLWFVG